MIDYDQIATEYARHRRTHPEVLKSLLTTTDLIGESTVLEVGCGTGNYITAIETHTGCTCHGIDPSAEMLARARTRSGSIDFRQGRIEQVELLPNRFDLVFSVDVIHHVADRLAYFQQAFKALKKGGRLCTVTDSESIIRTRQPLAVYFPETVEPELRRYPRIAGLCAYMEQVGFCTIAEQTVEFPYVLSDMQMYRDRAFSSLHIIPEPAFQRGLDRMERDLHAGPIPCLSRYTMLWGTKPA